MVATNVVMPSGGAVVACRACGGLWVDLLASQELARTGAPELEAVDDASTVGAIVGSAPRACPVCGDALGRVVFAQTELDACTRHGTFFDHAELGRVVRILERKRRLADPHWSSGDDMRWVSGTTSLTRPPPADAHELTERQRALDQTDFLSITNATDKLLRKLWSLVSK